MKESNNILIVYNGINSPYISKIQLSESIGKYDICGQFGYTNIYFTNNNDDNNSVMFLDWTYFLSNPNDCKNKISNIKFDKIKFNKIIVEYGTNRVVLKNIKKYLSIDNDCKIYYISCSFDEYIFNQFNKLIEICTW